MKRGLRKHIHFFFYKLYIRFNSQIVTAIILISLSSSIFACQKRHNENYFYTYIQSDPARLDPFYSTDVVSGRVLAKLNNGLFKIDKDGKLKKDIVKEYYFDGASLRIKLYKNIYFHNNQNLRARDVVFSITRIKNSKNPTSPRKWIFENVSTIILNDNYSLTIKLKQQSSTFLYLLTMPNCYIISESAHKNNEKIIGCGPFKLSSWKRDEKIALQKNHAYFGLKPKIDGIIFKIVPEDLTARFEFLNGTIDYFELPYLANVNMEKKDLNFRKLVELSTHYVALNTRKPPFNNKLFRKAINMAIDRKQIKKSLFNDRFITATGPVPPGLDGYRNTKEIIRYNPSKAKAIIKKTEMAGKEINLFIKSDHQISLICQMIQHYLNKCGLNVKIHQMEWSALKASVLKGNFEMAYFTWHADYPEAENFLYPLFFSKNIGAGGNRSFYNNKVVDKLLIKARRAINKKKRFTIYNKIERIIVDDAPWIFLWYGDKRIALSDRVKKFIPYPVYNGMKGNEIELIKQDPRSNQE